MTKMTVFFIFFLLVFGSVFAYPLKTKAGDVFTKQEQELDILFSTFKIPGMVSNISVDCSVYFPLGNFPHREFSSVSAEMDISNGILSVWLGKQSNITISDTIKKFFENYTGYFLGEKKIERNKYGDTTIYYRKEGASGMKSRAIDVFYNRVSNYSYSHIFSLQYLNFLNHTYNNGDFGYVFSYTIDDTGKLWGRIEFSKTKFAKYSNGLHTYDILKFLHISKLPPGKVTIEGNAMQTYTHTDFYFKSLKTNVPYSVENTTYYNVTKAFVVHIDAKKNITKLIISFETEENYNFDDFMTDYGGYIICGVMLVVPVAIIIALMQYKQKFKRQ